VTGCDSESDAGMIDTLRRFSTRRTANHLISFGTVSGEINAGCLSCWFFVGLPQATYSVLPGVRERIVNTSSKLLVELLVAIANHETEQLLAIG